MRSSRTMALMFSPSVESTSAPSTLLKRVTGMATETTSSPWLLTCTAWVIWPWIAAITSRSWLTPADGTSV